MRERERERGQEAVPRADNLGAAALDIPSFTPPDTPCITTWKVDRCKATWKGEFKLPWRMAGPLSMMKWIRSGRLSIKTSLSASGDAVNVQRSCPEDVCPWHGLLPSLSHTHTLTHTHTHTHTHTDRQTDRQTQTNTHTHTHISRERERDTHTPHSRASMGGGRATLVRLGVQKNISKGAIRHNKNDQVLPALLDRV